MKPMTEKLLDLARWLDAERDFMNYVAEYVVEESATQPSPELLESIRASIRLIHESLRAMIPPDQLWRITPGALRHERGPLS